MFIPWWGLVIILVIIIIAIDRCQRERLDNKDLESRIEELEEKVGGNSPNQHDSEI